MSACQKSREEALKLVEGPVEERIEHKSSPEGEAGKVSKARTKLRCAVYLALHSARMELEEHQELSLEDRTSTAKAAWASFNVLDNNFEAEQAARLKKGKHRAEDHEAPPPYQASLAHVPVARTLLDRSPLHGL
ncbi:hypothetical protein JCM3766R1_006007 [Sporobolomyces carnicolor]